MIANSSAASRPYELTVDADPASVRRAREFFSDVAERLELSSGQVELGVLAVSELVTNAIVHAPGPISVRVQRGPTGVRIEIGDCSSRAPRMGVPTPDRSGSRGLPIVAVVADEWGWDGDRDDAGKRVWCTIGSPD
ncbi:MAG: ATP-binding protein [Acidimicrobiia bacterium]